MNNFIELSDEVLAEDKEIMDELVKEEIEPLIKYQQEREKKIFEKAYKEVLDLEEEL